MPIIMLLVIVNFAHGIQKMQKMSFCFHFKFGKKVLQYLCNKQVLKTHLPYLHLET